MLTIQGNCLPYIFIISRILKFGLNFEYKKLGLGSSVFSSQDSSVLDRPRSVNITNRIFDLVPNAHVTARSLPGTSEYSDLKNDAPMLALK